MPIINLTPHAINIYVGMTPMKAYPDSGKVARVSTQNVVVGEEDGVRLVAKTFGDVVDLPEPAEGVYYIVSSLVALACPDRTDLLVPDDLVRDDTGRVVGCRCFSVNQTAKSK